MASLMSIFDPSMSIPHFGWMAAMFSMIYLKLLYWKSPSSTYSVYNALLETSIKLFAGEKAIFVMLFIFILSVNLLGLLPLVFSPSSHLSFNMAMALCLWAGLMIWYLQSNLDQFLAHLVPVGSPMLLSPALVLIELISSLIRPITLSLRLMANIMAGHMILVLISKGIYALSTLLKMPLFVILTGFTMFELTVALIQAYVFSSLMSLYWEESSSSH